MKSPRIDWFQDLAARPWAPWKLLRKLERVETVTMEVGRGDSSIRATVYADGRVGLALGSGEEFVGLHRDMPAMVSAAARRVLDVAGSVVVSLPRDGAQPVPVEAIVRFAVRTSGDVYVEGPRSAELKDGRSPLAPLWDAFADLVQPMLVVLFSTYSSPDHARCDSPALTLARRVWH